MYKRQDAYIDRLLEAKAAPESEQQKTFILKAVRVVLNTISHSLDLMKQGGIDAGMHRQETDEALILTINIPQGAAQRAGAKTGRARAGRVKKSRAALDSGAAASYTLT